MAEIEDRLLPKDGLNTYNVVLSRMELGTHGGAQFVFGVTNSMLPAGEFQVSVPAGGQSLDRMAVEAHDALIDILRQLMFRADKARAGYERPRPVLVAGEEEGFGLEMPRRGFAEEMAWLGGGAMG